MYSSLGTFSKLQKATVSFVKSAAWNNSGPTRKILIKFDIWVFFQKSVEKIPVSLKSDKNKGYFT